MSAKRTRSQANLEEQGNAPKQTKITSMIRAPSNSPSTKDKKAAAPKPAKKPASKKDPTPAKLYKDTLNQVDKKFNVMLKRYKPNPRPMSGITSDNFAAAMASFIPKTQQLAETSPIMAFNLVLDLGEHAYGDLDGCVNASGYGGTEEPYQELDDLLVSLINARLALDENKGLVPGQEYKAEPPHEEVGVLERQMHRLNRDQWEKRGPNKQAGATLDRAHREDLRGLLERRRERREIAEDWAGNALNDLLETGGRIDHKGCRTTSASEAAS
ncbi:hypothetical protein F5Y02DRAFT_427029 [Annulohypoxylon stygium]|nr:hypothetical protein F5Y02DRAFT_427029 [Annulohypoxylon stygium]